MESEGLIAEGSWRLPEDGEQEPAPRNDERVLLVTHIERGFSLPLHPISPAFLGFFGAQLHHLPQHCLVLSCICILVRELPRLPSALGAVQALIHVSSDDREEILSIGGEDQCGAALWRLRYSAHG